MNKLISFNYSTVVLCNGSFPEHRIPLGVLNGAEKIVCCDGAAEKLLRYGREPHEIVGDMDSLSDELKARYADRIFRDPDQESNDQTKAVCRCAALGVEQLAILGATGLREDHTIGNISLLSDYSLFIDAVSVTDTGIFVPVNRSARFTCPRGAQISIFAINPQTRVTSFGLKYPLSGTRLLSWYRGTLNETIYDSFELEMDAGGLIVYRKF
jgi:thiamine pyrophosphokinase